MPQKTSKNLDQAIKDLKLNEEEISLYQHHLKNLYNSPVINPDGSTSTFRSITVTDEDGNTHVIPTVYEGKIVSNEEAVQRAKKLKIFPSYKSVSEAEQRYQRIHDYMERDLKD